MGNNKTLHSIKRILIGCVIFIFFIALTVLILMYFDPITKYEQAWKKKDRAFFINKIADIYKEKDTNKILNITSYITDVSNYYIIEFGEHDYEKKRIKDLKTYKMNIIFGLSVSVYDADFFSGKVKYLPECRKYDSLLSLSEKIQILKKLDKK